MLVRCRATADYRGNAVGAVELECTAAGLRVTLAGVCSYREGYAPGPPVHSDAVCVPWPGVYATLLGSDELLLSLDASRLPLNRFRLGEFSEVAPPEAAHAARTRRRRWALGLALALGAVLALVLAGRGALPYPGAVRTFGVALLIAGMSALVARAAGRRSLSSEEVLHELSLELARHLTHHIPREPIAATPRLEVVPALSARLPRSAFAVAATLAATSLAAIVGSGAAQQRGEASRATLAAAAWTSPGAPGAAALTPGTELPAGGGGAERGGGAQPAFGAECRCARDESWLWSAPVARLSPLVIASTQRVHDGHPHLELELALVNDGSTPLVDLTLTVLFQERSPDGSQRQTGERALHFDGPLAPGRATRWHVEGLGTNVDLIAPDLGNLADNGSDAAPPDALAELAAGPERALALHGARVLAFLGDARARRIALALQQNAAAGETAAVERLLDDAPLAACDLSVARESSGQWRTRACVHNRSQQAHRISRARLLAFAEPIDPARPGERVPQLLAEHPSPVAAELGANSGRRLEFLARLDSEESRAPRAFELVLEESGP